MVLVGNEMDLKRVEQIEKKRKHTKVSLMWCNYRILERLKGFGMLRTS